MSLAVFARSLEMKMKMIEKGQLNTYSTCRKTFPLVDTHIRLPFSAVVQFEEEFHGDEDQGGGLDVVQREKTCGLHGFEAVKGLVLHLSPFYHPAHKVL